MRMFLSCFCLLGLTLLLTFPGQAQARNQVVQDWLQVYDNPDYHHTDDPWGLAVDNSGNVFITGSTNMGTTGDQHHYYLTVKYNTEGTEQWVNTYNRGDEYCHHYARDIVVDHEGNSYVTGMTQEWSEGQTKYDYGTIKYGPGGVVLWVAIYGNVNTDPNNADDWGYSLVIDSSENVYVTGITEINGTTDMTVGYATIKYNPDGTLAWASRFETVVVGNWNLNAFIPKIGLDQAGNVYVAGTKSDRSGDPHTSDLILVKYNNEGVFQWSSIYDSTDNYSEELYDLVVDKAGNAYLTGSATNPDNSSDDDFITVKFNTNGAILWDDRYDLNGGRDMARAIALDSQENVLVTGRGYMDGVQTITIKYDQDGTRLWLRKYAGDEDAGGSDIVLDNEDNIYVTGEKYLNYYRCALLKYNKNGKLIWQVGFGDNNAYGARNIALDDDRNVYIAGINYDQTTLQNIFSIKFHQTGAETSQIPQIFLLLSED